MTSRQKILVVDDDEKLVKLVKVNPIASGYNVLTACNGYEALDVIEEQEVDLVLLDVTMPGMDGFQTVAHIRRLTLIPVIMLTARADITATEKAFSSGADDYITKPFSIRELLARVQSKIKRSPGTKPFATTGQAL